MRSKLFLAKHKSETERIYILGNGPSFKPQYEAHKEALSKACLMSVNGFPLTDYFELLKPQYYIICSPGFYNSEAVDYNVNVRKEIIDRLINKTSWPLYFFIPVSSKSNKAFLDRVQSNPNIKLIFYNTTPVDGFEKINHFYYRRGWGSPRPHNVMIPAILNSILSGFKSIYLLGADHSWLPQISVNQKNEVLINQKHFYDEDESKPLQMHKDEGQGNRKMHEVLQKFYYSFKSYHQLDHFARSQDAKIYNLTEGSFIDAYEKLEINQHFKS